MCLSVFFGTLLLAIGLPFAGTQDKAIKNQDKGKQETSMNKQCLGAWDIQTSHAIAVYKYSKDYENISCDNIDFNISRKKKVEEVISSFKAPPFNGEGMGTIPNAYVYFIDTKGIVGKAKVVGNWEYLLIDNQWGKLYPLSERASEILQKYIQAPSLATAKPR
jgi:hypothetical protein